MKTAFEKPIFNYKKHTLYIPHNYVRKRKKEIKKCHLEAIKFRANTE